MKQTGILALVAWVVTALVGYFGVGGWTLELFQRMSGGKTIPFEVVYVFGALALVSIVLTIIWAKNLGHGSTPEVVPTARRKFLLGSAAVTGGAVGVSALTAGRVSGWLQSTVPMFFEESIATAPAAHDSWQGARIVSKKPLGSTGFMVSDITFGAGAFTRHSDPEGLLREAINRGVNFIDTSPDYAGAKSEIAVGNVLKDSNRQELFVVTKWCDGEGHIPPGSPPEVYLAALDDSLARLQTDYVDLIHVHNCWSVERLLDPNLHKAFEIAKQQGKVRFLGMSSHSPNLEEVANKAIDSGRFDVMMLAYHHGSWPGQEAIIQRASENGMGIVAMKTLKGAKHRGMLEFQDDETSYAQAAFKWVNTNPHVSCLVISFFETQHLDEYLHASGKSLTEADVASLNKYDELIAGKHCFAHCGECLSACPESLPINDVLRHRMYFEDYGNEKEAMRLYAELQSPADKCLTCSAPCIGVCPQGVQIQERMIGAHERLSMIA